MAVPFYLPEGGPDDSASSAGGTSSDGTSTASSQSPNTTTSATQTPMQSPLVPGEQLVMAICEAFYRYSVNSATSVFQYPTPPSPSCSVHSPSYTTSGDVFFPRGRSTPRTPRTSVSFAAGEEVNFFRQSSSLSSTSTSSSASSSSASSSASTQTAAPPQSAPPMPTYYQQPHCYHSAAYLHSQYTPPPTPTTATACTSTAASSTGLPCTNTHTMSTGTTTTTRLHRSHSDGARRSRLTSTGEDEREYHSEHETSWDEFDDRFDNFTAGRERLQEFNGRIPPRKKKKDVPKPKPEKKEKHFTWPTVVTVFVFAMGCGFLVAR